MNLYASTPTLISPDSTPLLRVGNTPIAHKEETSEELFQSGRLRFRLLTADAALVLKLLSEISTATTPVVAIAPPLKRSVAKKCQRHQTTKRGGLRMLPYCSQICSC
jgi:hypothetical protein